MKKNDPELYKGLTSIQKANRVMSISGANNMKKNDPELTNKRLTSIQTDTASITYKQIMVNAITVHILRIMWRNMSK